jgi:hypothetical protein
MQKVTVWKNTKDYIFSAFGEIEQDKNYITLESVIQKIINDGDHIEQVIPTKHNSKVLLSTNKEAVVEAIIIHYSRLEKSL